MQQLLVFDKWTEISDREEMLAKQAELSVEVLGNPLL